VSSWVSPLPSAPALAGTTAPVVTPAPYKSPFWDGGAHIDGTHNGSVKESRVGTVTQDVKQFSGVEHDAGELLEEGLRHMHTEPLGRQLLWLGRTPQWQQG